MKNRIRKFNESEEKLNEFFGSEESKVYTKDDVINLMYDFKLKELGKFNSSTDEEWNFTNPNGRYYVSLDRIKSKIVDFMNDK
jgi:hypothetical protein